MSQGSGPTGVDPEADVDTDTADVVGADATDTETAGIASDAAQTPGDADDTTAGDTTADGSPDEDAPEAGAEPEEELDPAEALRQSLRSRPGEWYVVHSYAGYENKVKANLETRVQTLDVADYIFQVEVPTEEVTEIKNG
ncbi:MAG: transcription termination/antitermination NusG family protein, partial [Pseudonocardia sp.]